MGQGFGVRGEDQTQVRGSSPRAVADIPSQFLYVCVRAWVFYTYHKLTGNGNICLAQRARPTGF